MNSPPSAAAIMRRALEVARQGIGQVEPNPPVGAILIDDQMTVIAEGWHRVFGGPHAEVDAIRRASGRTTGATLYVTLEPCAHQGKTPPCTQAIIDAGIRRVVIGATDPVQHSAQTGCDVLTAAGIDVQTGLLRNEAEALIAPFRRLMVDRLPWVHAKWAMTLDGRIASRTGSSQWISCDASRRIVHGLRGCMDAIMIGAGTARIDNPLLTVRPPGHRTPIRIVLDPRATLDSASQLLTTTADAPVLVVCAEAASSDAIERLTATGAEVLIAPTIQNPLDDRGAFDLPWILHKLAERRLTHVLVEGGSGVFGSLFDASLVNEVHVFVAPRIIGGERSLSPVAGIGLADMTSAINLTNVTATPAGTDVYIHGRFLRDRQMTAHGTVRTSRDAAGTE